MAIRVETESVEGARIERGNGLAHDVGLISASFEQPKVLLESGYSLRDGDVRGARELQLADNWCT